MNKINKAEKISVVIPVYNGAATITKLVERLNQCFDQHYELELILVNDGSKKDNSAKVCEQLAVQYANIIFLDLSKNYGEHNAVMAGLNYVSGDCAIIMDDDNQNPPEELFKLIEEFERGFEVVYSRYEKKQHHFFRNLMSNFNGMVATFILNKPSSLYLSSFKLISKYVVSKIIQYQGAYPYIDGLIFWITDNVTSVTVRHNAREEGSSNYTLKKLISLWLNMFFNFSLIPLRMITFLGVVTSVIAFFGIIWVIFSKIQDPNLPLGWASILIAILFIGSMQMIGIGVLGEYLGRFFLNSNKRPQYSIKRVFRNGKINN